MSKRSIKLFIVTAILLQIIGSSAYAGIIPDSWMNSLVLIETQDGGKYEPWATGFFVNSSKSSKTVLVTNKHTFTENKKNLSLFIRVNKKDPRQNEESFERIKIFSMKEPELRPVKHEKADLAALHVMVPHDIKRETIKFGEVRDSFFLAKDLVPIGDEIFLIGFPASIRYIKNLQKQHSIPVIRGGLISAKYKEADTDLFLIDAPSYWINSGGPVFIRPSIHNVTGDPGFDIPPKSQDKPKLIGVVSAMLPIGWEWDIGSKRISNGQGPY